MRYSSITLVFFEGHRGQWYSNNPNVQVDQKSGIALATYAGNAIVSYQVSSDMTTKTEVGSSEGALSSILVVCKRSTDCRTVMKHDLCSAAIYGIRI